MMYGLDLLDLKYAQLDVEASQFELIGGKTGKRHAVGAYSRPRLPLIPDSQ